jgi:hypothetical protein
VTVSTQMDKEKKRQQRALARAAAKAKAETLQRLKDAAERRHAAEWGLHYWIVVANEKDGISMREIAQAVGLSHQRVHQIIREVGPIGDRSVIDVLWDAKPWSQGARQGAHQAES